MSTLFHIFKTKDVSQVIFSISKNGVFVKAGREGGTSFNAYLANFSLTFWPAALRKLGNRQPYRRNDIANVNVVAVCF